MEPAMTSYPAIDERIEGKRACQAYDDSQQNSQTGASRSQAKATNCRFLGSDCCELLSRFPSSQKPSGPQEEAVRQWRLAPTSGSEGTVAA